MCCFSILLHYMCVLTGHLKTTEINNSTSQSALGDLSREACRIVGWDILAQLLINTLRKK